MKCNVKMHQQISDDVIAFEGMLLYILGELHKNEGYGRDRLRRTYDSTLLEMLRDAKMANGRISLGAGDSYVRFAMDYGLTFEAFLERQKDALAEMEREMQEKIEETWAARRAYLEGKKNGRFK